MSSTDPVRVVFQPEGRSVFVLPGTTLIEAAGEAGITLELPCGGQGVCGKCRVEITKNAPTPSEADRRHLSAEDVARGVRLACRAHVTQEMCVNVPLATRFFEHKILTNGTGRAVALHPTVTKQHVALPAPALGDQRADADRLVCALSERSSLGLDILQTLPAVLRKKAFDVTVVTAEGRVVALEPGDTTAHNYGVAFDIGTTTVVGFLLDLVSGREIAVAARTNPQIPFGDDVVSRIRHASTQPNGLKELQSKIVEGLNDIIEECCRKAGIAPAHLYEATIVGNTTMHHLFLGINPEYVAQAPYVAVLRRSINVRGRDVGLRIHPCGVVHVLPNIAGFVGADTVGVVLAAGMHQASERALAIDIGTNGELVIGNKDRLVSCSTAAGPAFEGARIRFGMRAADGAIDKILIGATDLEYSVIGNTAPRGLCGTALIDLVAELLRTGVIEPTGRLLPPEEMPAGVPDAVKRRVIDADGRPEFVIVPKAQSAVGHDVVLTQRDVRELQLAKGAIAAGAAILMKEFGVEPKELGHILLAGAFGNFIRRKMARRIGLLPDVPTEKILYIGNAAGAGARMALQSRKCKDEANHISERCEYLELAGRPDFQQEFTNAMMFPEG